MFNAIGRFIKKIAKQIKKALKQTIKNLKNKDKVAMSSLYEEAEFEREGKSSVALKLVTIMVAASGVFFLNYATAGAGAPVASALGGALVRAASDIWDEA